MHNKRMIFIVLLFLLIFFTPDTMFAATTQKTVELQNKETNVQIIVEGENDDFEVEIKLPNGTSVTSETQKENEHLYIPMVNKRIWVIKDGLKGTYTLTISGDVEQNFNAYSKQALVKPTIEWVSPEGTVLNVRDSEEFELTWNTTGDIRDEIVSIRMENEVFSFDLGESNLGSNRHNIVIPQNVPNGSYDLVVNAELGPDEVEVETNVVIKVDRDPLDGSEFTLIDQGVEDGNLYMDIQVSKKSWEFMGSLINQAGEIVREFRDTVDETMIIEEKDTSITYRWVVGPIEEGTFTAAIYGLVNGNQATETVTLEEFVVKTSTWDEDSITWSIEKELTNLHILEFTLEAEEGTALAVFEDEFLILDEEVSKEKQTFAIPLTQGSHLYSVVVKDLNGNTYTFEKVLQVDHEAPRLEMIQPLQSHESALDGFASGFVEPGSILKIDGKEVEYDENGYFKLDIGGSFTLSLTDKAGNLTEYTWEEQNSNSKWLMIFIGMNVIIIGAAAVVVLILRKNK